MIFRIIVGMVKIFLLGVLVLFGYMIYSNTRGGLDGLAITFTDLSVIVAPYIYFKYISEDNGTTTGFVGDTAGLIIFTFMVLAIGMALVILVSFITGTDPFELYVPEF